MHYKAKQENIYRQENSPGIRSFSAALGKAYRLLTADLGKQKK